MVGFFADNVERHLGDAAPAALEFCDEHGDPVRDLLFVLQKDFFAHDLAEHEPLALVGYDVFGEERLALGECRDDRAAEFFDPPPLPSRNGVHVARDTPLVQCFHVLRNVLCGHDVRLCVGDEHRHADGLVMLHQGDVLFGDALVPVVHE